VSASPRELPSRPSREYLRKRAKRLAAASDMKIALAQHRLAGEYGARNWADRMRRIEDIDRKAIVRAPLAEAARAGDLAAVHRLLASGDPVDGDGKGGGTPLWEACAAEASTVNRLEIVEALLAAGASTRRDDAGETALHAAAAQGPYGLVERLIRGGALEWQQDRKGRTPLQVAKRSRAVDKAAIIELLDRPVIRDPSFRAAVALIQGGDTAGLGRLLDAEPRLLHARIIEPDCYRDSGRPQYFLDPRLFWFIANNPTLMTKMPANICNVAETMIVRGVERSDLDYALELVMTSAAARAQMLQAALIGVLLKAGATPNAHAIDMTLAYRELDAIQALLDGGYPMTLPIAAAMGLVRPAGEFLRTASAEATQAALGMAIINGRNDVARLALDAGADPNGFLPVHTHSLPLHQAVTDENVDLIDLLISRGARTDIPDGLWGGTPLGWAMHAGKAGVVAHLEKLGNANVSPPGDTISTGQPRSREAGP
jgi:ankyrin repeat protein